MITISGRSASKGIATGKLFVIKKGKYEINKETVSDSNMEMDRFAVAKKETVAQFLQMADNLGSDFLMDEKLIFETYAELVEDVLFSSYVEDVISSEKITAEYAVCKAGDYFANLIQNGNDEYIKDRALDIYDVVNQILRSLSAYSSVNDIEDINKRIAEESEKVVLVLENLSPSEMIQIKKENVAGFCVKEGSINDHTAILARSKGIPAIFGYECETFDDYDGLMAHLDGDKGILKVFSNEEEWLMGTGEDGENSRLMGTGEDGEKSRLMGTGEDNENNRLMGTGENGENSRLMGTGDVNENSRLMGTGDVGNYVDGKNVRVMCNIESPCDLDEVIKNGGDGIGLFRTEYIFLESDEFPSEEKQFEIYKKIAEGMSGKPVIIRTLDLGADKNTNYVSCDKQVNPAMGIRGIRYCLENPEIFKTQLRALYRASAYGNISIMFPMITSVWEILESKRICCEVIEELCKENIPFMQNVELGIMIETPAAVLIADELAGHVDFFSIGTNDLTQYTLACDRQNQMVERFFDNNHPALFKEIKMVCDAAHRNGISVSMCGEMAADGSALQKLLEYGISELSVSPRNVPNMKEILMGTGVR